jgi:hypothetical protein
MIRATHEHKSVLSNEESVVTSDGKSNHRKAKPALCWFYPTVINGINVVFSHKELDLLNRPLK